MSYRSLIRERTGLVGIAFLAVFSGNLGQSFLIGLFQAPIAARLEMSAGGFGSVYSLVSLCAGFLVLYFGSSLDWVAPRRFALLVLGGLVGGIALLTLSPWVVTTLLGLGLVRLCGQGLLVHLGATLAGREFGAQRGRALGLASLGMPLGEVLLTPAVALGLVWLGWRESWWLLVALLGLCWLPLLRLRAWPPAPGPRPEGEARRFPQPLREARFWRLLPLMMVMPVAMTGIFLYQAQMVADLGAATATYALALVGKGIARLPGALMGGHWVDRWGERRLGRLFLLPFAVALVVALLVGGDIAVWALMLGGGLVVGMQEPVVNSLLVSLWGSEHLGRIRAVLSASVVLVTGIAPAVFGILLDLGIGFASLLAGILALLVASWLLALRPIAEAGERVD